MDNFALAQETDDVDEVGVVGDAEDVVVDSSGFLFGGEVFDQVGDGVAGDGDGGGAPGDAGGVLGIHAVAVL